MMGMEMEQAMEDSNRQRTSYFSWDFLMKIYYICRSDIKALIINLIILSNDNK